MAARKNLHSLLPYLDPTSSPIYLKIARRVFSSKRLEKGCNPFVIISDSDPLTRLLRAKFSTQAGGTVKDVFLLVQRDRYHISKSRTFPITNRDIDDLWLQAFQFYLKRLNDGSFIVLSKTQLDQKGKLRPQRSLFFCREKDVFFHPPCPDCGSALDLCNNDALLTAEKLHPYSSTVRRYLYCPICYGEKGASTFYAPEVEDSCSPLVQDRWALIEGFSRVPEVNSERNQFPCIGCPDHGECYGPNQPAKSRISIFSFYPFYLFVFEAMSLHAHEFLALISGASHHNVGEQLISQGEMGRKICLDVFKKEAEAKSPFFFDEDGKSFLEIMYLKLSFLGQIIPIVLPTPNHQNHPAFDLSMDGFWVKTEVSDSRLPFLWNFKVSPLHIGMAAQKDAKFLGVPYSQRTFSLAFLWFYTFLVNEKQSIKDVYRRVGEEFNRTFSRGRFQFEDFLKEPVKGFFFPENIFWKPVNRSVHKGWYHFWRETLDLGSSLLKTSFATDSGWSKDAFIERVNALTREVKRSLFHEIPHERHETAASEDKPIYEILTGIKQKWQQEVEGPTRQLDETTTDAVPHRMRPDETVIAGKKDDVIPETIIDSPDPMKKGKPWPVEPDGGDIPETIIAGGVRKPEAAFKPAQDVSSKYADFRRGSFSSEKRLEGKRILNKGQGKPDEDDYLTETVILTPDWDKEKD